MIDIPNLLSSSGSVDPNTLATVLREIAGALEGGGIGDTIDGGSAADV